MYISVCVVKWKIIPKFVFNPQVPKVKGWKMEWPILRELRQKLWQGWERNIFHGVRICASGCAATESEAGRERLSEQAGWALRTYVSDLDIKIKVYRHRLEEALEMRRKEEENLKMKREEEGQEEKGENEEVMKHEDRHEAWR